MNGAAPGAAGPRAADRPRGGAAGRRTAPPWAPAVLSAALHAAALAAALALLDRAPLPHPPEAGRGVELLWQQHAGVDSLAAPDPETAPPPQASGAAEPPSVEAEAPVSPAGTDAAADPPAEPEMPPLAAQAAAPARPEGPQAPPQGEAPDPPPPGPPADLASAPPPPPAPTPQPLEATPEPLEVPEPRAADTARAEPTEPPLPLPPPPVPPPPARTAGPAQRPPPSQARAPAAPPPPDVRLSLPWGSGPQQPPVPGGSAQVVGAVTQPTARYRPEEPRYPEVARLRGQTGTVRVRLRVDETGRVTSVEVLDSAGDAVLDRAAQDYYARWRFNPARRADGQPVAASAVAALTWRLTQ